MILSLRALRPCGFQIPLLTSALIGLAPIACAPAPPPPPAPPVVPVPPPTAAVTAIAAPEEPKMPREEALARALSLATEWAAVRWNEEKMIAWIGERGLDETHVRRMLEGVARPCLDGRARDTDACKELGEDTKDVGKAAYMLVDVLAELANPTALTGPSVRVLVRLDARGYWRGDKGVERILERRMEASAGACKPPSTAEIDAAKQSIGDLAVITPEPRWPSAAELDELAYFYAAIAAAGPIVGHGQETIGAPLPPDHPDFAERKRLADEMRDALLDGDLPEHARASDAYLRTLGYPGPLRLAQEGDMRWGGAGASFVMRDAARTAEILGHYDLAESLYRRANPGGGGCGTSVDFRRDDQIRGAIRSAEMRAGCRAALAERLYTIEGDLRHVYDTARLTKAGFDVPRLYAGALLTIGRDDAAALDRAIKALPTRSNEAAARFAKLGPEAWSARVRALPGYADTARDASLDRLLLFAERGAPGVRAEAMSAIGRLAEDRGNDPCLDTGLRFSFRGWSRSDRQVRSAMNDCSTRIPAKTVDGALARIAAMAGDPDAGVREAVAVALGRLGSQKAKTALTKLAKDTFDAGGTVCVQRDDGPQICGPNRPVARAAEDALKKLGEAETHRREQRASARRAPRKKK